MTIRLTFDLDTVRQLAEHAAAAAAAAGTDHTGTDRPGPALLLRSGSNGIWLTSNAAHPQPAPAGQPGTLDRRAAFATQCPPGTPSRAQARLLRTEATPLMHVLALDEPAGLPLLQQLRAGDLAGATTVTVLLSGAAPSVAVGRRRERGLGHHQPRTDAQRPHWQNLLHQYRPLPHYERIRVLMARIDRLREDNARLHHAHLTLTGFGVLAQRDDVFARTAAFHQEARGISAELHTLGAHEAARLAVDGWYLTLTTHRAPNPGN
ncbi:hypothetical protein [Dactylosporangium sp. CA-139066]|uniref:hypothetical protein n=1 Tax=Dactylosporangium sp. CA-139066 TaxID=3239930 RepID=UPI003D910E9D